nr:type I polyketide synthase [Paenibacillus kobensis]
MRMLRKHWELCPLPERSRSRSGKVVILATEETRSLALELSRLLVSARVMGMEELRNELHRNESGAAETYSGLIDLIGCGTVRHDAEEDWMAWLQWQTEHGGRDGLTMLGVTIGLEADLGQVNLSGAVRTGLYRMLQSEYSHLRSRHVDLESECGEQLMAEQMAAELQADSEDAEVRYRNGVRYRSCLRELPMDGGERKRIEWPDGQALWITGGTRGIGALCAKHFVRRCGVRKLVLTGRETLPPRELWDGFAADPDSATGRKIRAIRELEALGAQVKVLALELTDEEAVRRSVSEVKAEWGAVGGVLHCAGIVDLETPAFIRKQAGIIRQVLAPKVAGLDVLYRSMREEPLRFFVLFSSVSAVVPALASGQGDYAMANAYMDYAAQAWSGNCPVVSVQWPNWKETGMGEVRSRVYGETGLLAHTDAEGLEMLDRILSQGLGPVVLPAIVDPERWRPERLLMRSLRDEAKESKPARQVPSPHGTAEHTRLHEQVKIADVQASEAQLQAGEEHVLSSVHAFVTGVFAKELKLASERLDPDTPFADYGVDSILLAQVVRTIRQTSGVDLDPSILYEYPDIRSLSAWLAEKYGDSFSVERTEPRTDSGTMAKVEADIVLPSSPPEQPRQAATVATAGGTGTGMGMGMAAAAADIAVIGLSCRFPGSETPDGYWRLLSEGRSALRSVSEARWTGRAAYDAGVLDRPRTMSASVFRITEQDAALMDPQALLLLEESLKAWHDAGYKLEEIRGRSVGVYIGARSKHEPEEESLLQARNPILAVGSNYLAANLSQFFDLRGPSLVLDTACSSALVGLNVAVQALRGGEIECALVGGVSLLDSDKAHRLFRQRGILSPEPQFHVFDGRANGVVLSEGAGVVLLKPVEQAVKDGDRIYAVIKGAAVNNDGRTAGPAAPNPKAQTEVMRLALARSGKKPEEIGYIEANGSGSEVNDLLELKAIRRVYRKENDRPLSIGSAKPNIGHPLCAEGIAAFIKVVLMLDRREKVPFLSGRVRMKHFDVESSPFYFSRETEEWTGIRTAAVNCFADGGTNAHVILEGWEEHRAPNTVRQPLPSPAVEPETAVERFGGTSAPVPTFNFEPDEPESEPMLWDTFG